MADIESNSAPVAPAPVVAQKPVVAPAETIPLEEYLTELSQRDTRHELVNGFYSEERRTQKFHGTRAEYEARYAAFQNAPA